MLVCRRRRGPDGVRHRAPRAGFSLIELLVTLALIAVLAGLLLPALRRARDRTRDLVCRHHLRQWALATQLYAVDHDDLLPPEGFPNPTDRHRNVGWYIQLPVVLGLPPYHDQPWRTNPAATLPRSVWLCPANPRRSNGRNLFHYCLNQHVDGTGEDEQPMRLSVLPRPGATIWLFDSKNLPAVGSWGFVPTNLHAGGATFAFLDGRAARFPAADFWDFTAGRGRTNHPGLVWIP